MKDEQNGTKNKVLDISTDDGIRSITKQSNLADELSSEHYAILCGRLALLTPEQYEARAERVAIMVFDGKIPAVAANIFCDAYDPELYGDIETSRVLIGWHQQ